MYTFEITRGQPMRLRILHKLLLGSAIYLAIAISFGVYVYSNIGQIRVKQRLVEIADDSREEVLEMRRNEKNYIIRRDAEYLNNIHEIAGRLRGSVSNLEPDIVSAFGKEDFAALKGSIYAYSSLIDRFSDNYKTEADLSEELRGAGRSLEDLVLRLQNQRLTRQVLEVRLLEKNYTLFKERKYIDGLKVKVAELRGGLTGQASLSLCDKYLGIADKLVLNTKSEAVLLGLVQDTAKEMQRVIEKVAGREREVIGAYLVGSQRLLLGALFLLVMLGPLTMWFIAKAISSPLRNLEATARKITEGELDLRVETKGDVETRSLQRSINAMLDRLRLSRESIEETVRLLQEKNAQLIESEKLASIGVLASGVAHEINNPLANISLTAETILDAGKDIPEEELKRLTKDIIEQTERAQAVVVNLLGYARAQKDERWEDVEVGEALARSLRLISHHIALHDVTLNDESGGPPLIVKGNRGKLEQVFVNIMVNALHAMEKGGTLTLRVHPDETGGYALIEFKDTGPGILLDNLQKVFDPFYTTKSMGEGTGLGLYVSYGIVRDHGGDIEVESKPGAGALFRVMLPLLKA